MAYQHLTFNFLAGIVGRSCCWLVFAGTYIYRSLHLFLARLLDRSLVQLYIQPLEVQKTVWFVKTAFLLESSLQIVGNQQLKSKIQQYWIVIAIWWLKEDPKT